MKIKNRFTDEVIYEDENGTMKETLLSALEGGADLGEANLRGAYLRGANLRGADLGEANLRGADLGEADLRGADLRGADLGEANLGEADLGGAYLGGAYLREADLRGADLGEANLRGADLRGADLGEAKQYYSFTAYDTSKRIVHCVKHNNTWMIQAGCFWGTLEELETKVKETHNSKVYIANIELLKSLED